VFRAARGLEDTADFHVTGKPKSHGRLRAELDSLPGNVHLTGFLSEAKYVELLGDADVVMVLTTLESCLTCGAYEAVSLGKAMVLSSTRAIQAYFHKGATYAAPDADSIRMAVVGALQQKAQLERDCRSLQSELDTDWRRLFRGLEDRLSSWA
jgi:glycosyltransferase involved in cell wall biosynthesis